MPERQRQIWLFRRQTKNSHPARAVHRTSRVQLSMGGGRAVSTFWPLTRQETIRTDPTFPHNFGTSFKYCVFSKYSFFAAGKNQMTSCNAEHELSA